MTAPLRGVLNIRHHTNFHTNEIGIPIYRALVALALVDLSET